MQNVAAKHRTSECVILVAEDNENDALLLRHAFVKAGLGRCVIFVEDGEQVIKYLTRQPPFDAPALCPKPTLLLLDARMPKMNGVEILLWLRLHPEVGPLPVLICTSALSPEQCARAIELGADRCLQKPFLLDDWSAMVENIKDFAAPGTPLWK